jgi:hypothetical protein
MAEVLTPGVSSFQAPRNGRKWPYPGTTTGTVQDVFDPLRDM